MLLIQKQTWQSLAIFILLSQDCSCAKMLMNYNENYNPFDTGIPNTYPRDANLVEEQNRRIDESMLGNIINPGFALYKYKRVPGSEFLGKRSSPDINYYSNHAAKRVPGSEFLGKRKRSYDGAGEKYNIYDKVPKRRLTEVVYDMKK